MGVHGQRRTLDRCSLVAAHVPHQYLARVRAGDDQVGMEGGEVARSDEARADERLLRRFRLRLDVPQANDRFGCHVLVVGLAVDHVVVGADEQLGIL